MTEVEKLYVAGHVDAPKKLVIGIVHGDKWDGWFGISLAQFLMALVDSKIDLPISEVLCVRSGPALQLGRGVLVNTFLNKTDADALLMLDSDMWFDIGTIAAQWNLFNQRLDDGGPIDILGGLAFIASAPRLDMPGSIQPNVWAQHPQNPEHCVIGWDYPKDHMVEVASTGAACLMVRRSVYEQIGRHYFHHLKILNFGMLARKFASTEDYAEIEQILRAEISDADEYGEDMSFCQRARALGHKIYVHTALKYGHSKTTLVIEDDYIASRQPKEVADDTRGPDDRTGDTAGEHPGGEPAGAVAAAAR